MRNLAASPVRSIWIPCEVFEVEVSVEDTGPTPVEKALMLFLAAKEEATFQDVTAFLNLGGRLTMDLIAGMWKLGYLVIDTVRGRIALDRALQEAVDADHWDGIVTAHRLRDKLAFMRELVGGQVAEDRSRAIDPKFEDCAPIVVATPLAEAVSRRDLGVACLKHPHLGAAFRNRRRNLSARFAREDVGSVARGLCWMRLEIEASTDPDVPGALFFRPVSADNPTLDVLAPGIAHSLTQWSLVHADHPFVRKLVKKAPRMVVAPGPSLGKRLRHLEAEVEARLAGLGVQEAQVLEWEEEFRQLAGEAGRVTTLGGKVRLHAGKGARRNLTVRTLREFESRLVILSPAIDDEGLRLAGSVLEEHLASRPLDAMAFVLWGSARNSEMRRPAHNYLSNLASQLQAGDTPRLAFSDRSSRIASGLILADGRQGVYSNIDPLVGREADEDFIFGLEIRVGSSSAFTRDALEMARERAPDFAMSDRIGLPTLIQRGPETSAPDSLWAETAATVPAASGKQEEAEDEQIAVLALRARLFDLRGRCGVLYDAVAKSRRTVELLPDTAIFQRTLDILGDIDPMSMEGTLVLGLGRDLGMKRAVPIHPRLVEAVERRAQLRLTTTVLVDPRSATLGVDYVDLETLAESHPDRVRVMRNVSFAGSFVCAETRFVCASAGVGLPPSAESSALATRLFGIAATDEALCRDFRLALAEHCPDVADAVVVPDHRSTIADHARRGPVINAAAFISAWSCKIGPERRPALRRAMSGPDGQLQEDAVRALLEFSAGTVACSSVAEDAFRVDLLSIAAGAVGSDFREPALRELVCRAWARRRWPEAALILEAALMDPSPVPAAMARAAMEVESGQRISSHEALEPTDPDGWVASVALGVKAVLLNGDDVAEALEVKLALGGGPEAAAPLTNVGVAAVEYWRSTGAGADQRGLRAAARRRDLREELPGLARLFVETWRKNANTTFRNTMVNRVVRGLYLISSGLREVSDLIGAGALERFRRAQWQAVYVALVKVLGQGSVDVDRLGERLLKNAYDSFREQDDPKIIGRYVVAIRAELRTLLLHGARLRDAIAANQQEDAENPTDVRLLGQIAEAMPTLGTLAASLALDSVARPLVDDLHAFLSTLAEAPR